MDREVVYLVEMGPPHKHLMFPPAAGDMAAADLGFREEPVQPETALATSQPSIGAGQRLL